MKNIAVVFVAFAGIVTASIAHAESVADKTEAVLPST